MSVSAAILVCAELPSLLISGRIKPDEDKVRGHQGADDSEHDRNDDAKRPHGARYGNRCSRRRKNPLCSLAANKQTAVPMTTSAVPIQREKPVCSGRGMLPAAAISRRKKLKRATTNPNPIIARPVLTHANNVRSPAKRVLGSSGVEESGVIPHRWQNFQLEIRTRLRTSGFNVVRPCIGLVIVPCFNALL